MAAADAVASLAPAKAGSSDGIAEGNCRCAQLAAESGER